MSTFRFSRRLPATIFALAAATAISAATAHAECGDPACAQKAEACEQAKQAGGCGCADKAAAAGASAGQQAYVDPETGKLAVPPAAGAAAGAEPASRAEGQPAAVKVPGGGVEAEAGPGLRSEMVATIGEDGQPKAKCDHAGAKHE